MIWNWAIKRAKWIVFLLLVLCLGYIGTAQRKYKSCTVSDDAGDTLRGYVSHFRSQTSILKGFKLYDIKKKRTKIHPDDWDNVQIDTVHYRSVRNQEGNYRFMKKLAQGNNAILCLEREQFFTGGLPGETVTSWYRNRYYLFRDDQWLYMDEEKLVNHPQYFFPNAPELCQKIKLTRAKDIAWVNLVEAYNKLDLNPTSN